MKITLFRAEVLRYKIDMWTRANTSTDGFTQIPSDLVAMQAGKPVNDTQNMALQKRGEVVSAVCREGMSARNTPSESST